MIDCAYYNLRIDSEHTNRYSSISAPSSWAEARKSLLSGIDAVQVIWKNAKKWAKHWKAVEACWGQEAKIHKVIKARHKVKNATVSLHTMLIAQLSIEAAVFYLKSRPYQYHVDENELVTFSGRQAA